MVIAVDIICFETESITTEWETPIQSATSCDHFPPSAIFELEAIGSPTLGSFFSGDKISAVVGQSDL